MLIAMSEDDPFDEPIQIPIDGVLDLHAFRPLDVKELLLAYLDECRAVGILEVRVIHGKGVGEIRRSVHNILAKTDGIERIADAAPSHGGWGATMVYLRDESC